MSQLADLDAHLEALKVKVTKSRIAAVTTICLENVKFESQIVQKLATHLRRSQPQQKLGVLYAVDTVVRQWIEKAAASGQNPAAHDVPEGTFASGVCRMRAALPVMMSDIVQSAPEDQKDKISKLVDIWDRGSVFDTTLLQACRQALQARSQATAQPVAGVPLPSHPQTQAAVVLPLPTASAAPVVVPTAQPQQMQTPFNGHPVQQTIPRPSTQAIPTPVVSIPQPAGSAPPASVAPAGMPDLANALSALIPGGVATDPAKIAYYVQVMQQLATLGVPPVQWGQVLQALAAAQAVPVVQVPTPVQQTPVAQAPVPTQAQTLSVPIAQSTQPVAQIQQPTAAAPQAVLQVEAQPVQAQHILQPQSQPAGSSSANQTRPHRSRSRSPTRGRGRGSPVYDTYQDGNNNLRQNFRQRSPLRDTAALQADMIPLNDPSDVPGTDGSKWTDMDHELAESGNIKVLSRTLFVGGVSCSDEELRQIFSRFGQVQSAIVNMDKRHAFVKMCNRADAVAARDGMEDVQDLDVASKVRKVRWGVGFGPRECNDYDTGISIVPVNRLTDADRKWALTAEYGGTGGKPLVAGLVMEEPDIEIGAGVSSKAISARRGPTGDIQTNHRNDHRNNHRNNNNDRRNYNNNNNVNYGGNSQSMNHRNRNSSGGNHVNNGDSDGRDNNQNNQNTQNNQNENKKLPTKPTQTFVPASYSQGTMSLPTPTSTGFVNANGPPAFGGATQNMLQLFQSMGMMNGQNGVNGQQGMNGNGQGYGGQNR